MMKFKLKLNRCFLGAVALVTSTIGCAVTEQHSSTIFRYNESAGISSLDPAFARNQANMWPVHQLFSTLVEYDSALTIRPLLAKKWIFSADKKKIIFTLRNDVYFHNDPCFLNGQGKKLVAQDVVFSLQRLMDKSTASPGAWIFSDKLDPVTPFSAPDDTTFIIHLIRPDITVLSSLSMPYCSIIPKEAIDYYKSEFRAHPVGTGPFSFVSWDESEALILHKNNRYFERDATGLRLPYLNGIKVSFLSSKTAEFLAFQQQQLDFVNDPDASLKDELISKKGVLRAAWMQQFHMQTGPYLNTEYLGFLLHDSSQPSLLNNVKIRKAINFGIDKKKLIFYLRNSMGTAANSGFSPIGLPSFDSNSVRGYTYNPDSAIQLLHECGFDANHPMPEITLTTVPNYAAMGSFIANELKSLGIHVKVDVVQKSLLSEQMSKGEVSFFRGSWIADFPDAINFFSVFYSKNPSPPNYTHFSNPTFDQLYEKALFTYDDIGRFALYRQMEQIIIDQAPVVPLWYDKIWQLFQKNLSGIASNPLNMLELRKVYKK